MAKDPWYKWVMTKSYSIRFLIRKTSNGKSYDWKNCVANIDVLLIWPFHRFKDSLQLKQHVASMYEKCCYSHIVVACLPIFVYILAFIVIILWIFACFFCFLNFLIEAHHLFKHRNLILFSFIIWFIWSDSRIRLLELNIINFKSWWNGHI